MHPAIQTLRNALAYAYFKTDDIKDETLDLVDKIGIDLDVANADYEPGPDVVEAVDTLEQTLNETDSATEDTNAALAEAKGDAVEDEEEEQQGTAK